MHKLRAALSRLAAMPKGKKLRIALIALLLLLALFFAVKPHGTGTYLVLGMDNYGSLSEIGRSDVMMLVKLDFSRSKITAVSFARDMLLPGKGSSQRKLNTIVRAEDEDALCRTISDTFGVPIDGWFRVNFTTVIELVDALGGAEVELTAEEASYIDKTAHKYRNYPLSEGICRLNGAQALAYARCRKLDNDIGRGKRQGKLLAALAGSARHMTAGKLRKVYDSMKHAWRSSLSAPQQVSLLGRALWLRGAKVDLLGMPFEGYWRYGDGGVIPDIPNNALLLQEALQ